MEIYAATNLIPMAGPPIPWGAIAVDSGIIVAQGTLAELRRLFTAPVHEFQDSIIMPGLINAHSHLELTHFPSWKLRKDINYSPRTYVDWVIQVIKIRRSLSHEELAQSVREGIYKSLEAGTTTVGEIVTDRSLTPYYSTSQLGGRLFFEAIGHNPAACMTLKSEIETAIDILEPGNFAPGISPHAPHTLSEQFMLQMVDAAWKRSLPCMIHVAESPAETLFFSDAAGSIAEVLFPLVGWDSYLQVPQKTTPVAWLAKLGVLGRETAAVHCVQVTPADAELLHRNNVNVVLCPRSNDRLAVGKAPVHLFKKLGISMALGTDSLASNDSLSLWDEMRFLQQEFPAQFTPSEILEMVTVNAAKALQLDNVGSLESGKRANFILMPCPAQVKHAELLEAVIAEAKIAAVYVGGQRI